MNFTKKSNSVNFKSMERGFSIQSGMQSLALLLSQIKTKVRHVLEGTRACEMFDICCGLVEESYFLKFLLFGILVNCVLPLVAFFVFALLTLITTFTGFLLLEGALLILAACVAILWFGAVGILFMLAATVTVFAYLVYRHAGDIAYKMERFYFSQGSDDSVVSDTDHED